MQESQDADLFTLEICLACKHFRAEHDKLGCFKTLRGVMADDDSPDLRRYRKEMKLLCWCPSFADDWPKAVDLILGSNNWEALKQGANDALDRAEVGSASKLVRTYIRETPAGERDVIWLDSANRQLDEQQKSYTSPFHNSSNAEVVTPKGDAVQSELVLTTTPLNLENSAEPMKDLQSRALWQSFRLGFDALVEKELASSTRNTRDRWLRAYVDYRDKSHKHGQWQLGGNLDEGLRERFDLLATKAGAALGSAPSAEPRDLWLHYVFLDRLEQGSNLLFAAQKDDGGIVVRVCEASAIYCARLEKRAVEAAVENPIIEKPHLQLRNPTSQRRREGRPAIRCSEFTEFAGQLWRNAKHEDAVTRGRVSVTELHRIAASLDEKGYSPPAEYLEKRCASEVRAFNSHNSNSKNGPIKTWVQLVTFADKDHLRGMRKLLSRSAEKAKSTTRMLSEN